MKALESLCECSNDEALVLTALRSATYSIMDSFETGKPGWEALTYMLRNQIQGSRIQKTVHARGSSHIH